MQIKRSHRSFMQSVAWPIMIGLCMLTPALADQVNITLHVNKVGDAEYKVDWPMGTQYSTYKQNTNPLYLARTLNDASSWHGVEELTGEFVDSSRSFKASMSQFGYAKTVKPGKWQIEMAGEDMALVAITDGVAHFSSAIAAGEVATNVILRVVLPEGSTNIRYDESSDALTFDHVPTAEDGDNGDIEIDLTTKDRVMSSLAKVYSEESFDNFWVARDQGDQYRRSSHRKPSTPPPRCRSQPVERLEKTRHRVSGSNGDRAVLPGVRCRGACRLHRRSHGNR